MLEVKIRLQRGDHLLDVDVKFDQRVVGLFGRSGAGKTTMLHAIAGLVAPQSGRIVLGGTVLFDSDRGINRPVHRRGVGLVFQDARLFPHYTVNGNLRYGQRSSGENGHRLHFRDVVDLLELGSLLKRRPQTLSGGERQRVALGRALLSAPALLLMDEPLTALDRDLKRQILPYLQRVRDTAKIPTIYVSHDLAAVLQLTDYLLILEQGRTVGLGTYRDLAQDHGVLDLALPSGLLNVLDMTITAQDEQAGCTHMKLSAKSTTKGTLTLQGPPCDLPVGQCVSVAIRPEDVAFSTQIVAGISVRNQFPGVIRRFIQHGGTMIVELDVGAPLLVEISAGSFERLELAVGKPIFCLLKANAIRILGPCGRG